MTTTRPSEGGSETPADLSELTATDGLLDRLGRRAATDGDLLDPTVAALLDLVAAVDEPRTEPDTGLAHLVEVLAGRPLYLAGAGLPADGLDVHPIIDLQAGEVDPEPTSSRVIDLTDHASPASSAPAEPLDDAEDPSEPARPVEISAARTLTGSISTAPTPIPIQAGARRWERALSSVSLPAASVLLLLAVSGGVSAAVTGNPMTPVNGVSRVMDQLPGVDNPQRSLTHVKGEITAASNAARKNDTSSASAHLAAARRGLSDVPDDQKKQLSLMIANVQTLLTPSPVVPTPPVGVGATSPSTIPTPIPSTPPSATPTVEPSTEPSTRTDPTDSPTTPSDVPVTTPPVDSTPVATASGS